MDFAKWPAESRFVLLNELGYGGVLERPPTIERTEAGYEVSALLAPSCERTDARKMGTLCPHTMNRLEGLDATIAIINLALGMAQGSWFGDLRRGSTISDFYWRYLESPWFQNLVKMEIIRLSCIPYTPRGSDAKTTPLACVKWVNSIAVHSFELNEQYIPISVDLELEGVGNWKAELNVFVSTEDQLKTARAAALSASVLYSPTVDLGLVEAKPVDKKLADKLKKLYSKNG